MAFTIDMTRKYVTKNGQAVRILCCDRRLAPGTAEEHCYCVVGLLISESHGEEVAVWTIEGRNRIDPDLDLREFGDTFLDYLQTDDPIWVKEEGGIWKVRHFAGKALLGGVKVWKAGMTSVTIPAKMKSRDADGGTRTYEFYREFIQD